MVRQGSAKPSSTSSNLVVTSKSSRKLRLPGFFVLLFFSPFPCYNGDTIFAKGVGKVLLNSSEYLNTVESIKQEIRAAQYRASVSVNRELLLLYHTIGNTINAHKTWGSKFIESLSADIKLAFPDASGYSVRNLKYMAKFALAYPDEEFVQQPVAQIPWGHNTVLLDKLSSPEERLWYAEKVIENGWSRNVLIHQIEGGLYQRQAIASKITNFEARLPASQSELALQTMKDPYLFDFIPLKENMLERDIEQDHPSIGLLLCKSKNDLVAEYSLKDMSKPIGVSAYRITSCLPEEFEKQLPSVEDLQKRIL